MAAPSIPGFSGDPQWVHRQEGHNGSAYWPGGASGVTLDPGFDLGAGSWSAFEQHYAPRLTAPQLDACKRARGLQGGQAKAALTRFPALRTIRITRDVADSLFPLVAAPYWSALVRRFPGLAAAPGPVQTALLSLGYNRGAGNKDLAVLGAPIASGQWNRVAALIHGMQQMHPLVGIRRRRRAEARLIDPTLKP